MKLGFWAIAAGVLILIGSAYAEDTPDPFLAPDATELSPALPPPESPSGATSTVSTTSDSTAPSEGMAAPPPSQPAEQMPISVSSIPGKTENSPKAAPPAGDIYEEYEDYKNRVESRRGDENDMATRAQFAHEDGGWQLSLDYIHRAFGDYNFNHNPDLTTFQGATPIYADTQGGMLSLGYFPFRSLSFGRLGVIAQAGIYFSKFSLDTPQFDATGAVSNMIRDDVKRQSASSYGARAVYEFQYFIGQLFVPFVTAGVDLVRMQPYRVAGSATRNVVDIPARNITTQNYGAGLHFNLNRVEPVVGSRALVNVGVKKFYLTYLALQRSGALSGLTHSLGLRFEF